MIAAAALAEMGVPLRDGDWVYWMWVTDVVLSDEPAFAAVKRMSVARVVDGADCPPEEVVTYAFSSRYLEDVQRRDPSSVIFGEPDLNGAGQIIAVRRAS